MECTSSKDPDQPGHPPSLIRVFTVRMKKAWVLSYPLSAQQWLIRLGWSESSLGTQSFCWFCHEVAQLYMDRVKRIWYLSPMRAAKVQASLRIHAVSPEPPLLAHTSSESRGTFRQKARSLASLNGWACAVKTCHDGMLEDTAWQGLYILQLTLACLTSKMNFSTKKFHNNLTF